MVLFTFLLYKLTTYSKGEVVKSEAKLTSIIFFLLLHAIYMNEIVSSMVGTCWKLNPPMVLGADYIMGSCELINVFIT
jgi:hypothetical protein